MSEQSEWVHIPLADCFLCAEEKCNTVGNNPRQCPACGDTNVMGLAGVLNREPKETQETAA